MMTGPSCSLLTDILYIHMDEYDELIVLGM